MRRNERKISEILRDFTNQKALKDKLLDQRVEQEWMVIYPGLKDYTRWVRIKNGILRVSIKSSVLRHEMRLHKQDIILRMNERMGDVCEITDMQIFG